MKKAQNREVENIFDQMLVISVEFILFSYFL